MNYAMSIISDILLWNENQILLEVWKVISVRLFYVNRYGFEIIATNKERNVKLIENKSSAVIFESRRINFI